MLLLAVYEAGVREDLAGGQAEEKKKKKKRSRIERGGRGFCGSTADAGGMGVGTVRDLMRVTECRGDFRGDSRGYSSKPGGEALCGV